MSWLIGLIAILALGGAAMLLASGVRLLLVWAWEVYGVLMICSDDPEDDYHTPPDVMAAVYAKDRRARKERQPCKS